MPRIVLWIGVATFAFFGLLFTFAFDFMLEKMDVVTGNTGKVDLIATYAGFEIGFAAFLAWCAIKPERLKVGLVASGLAFAGFGGGRAAGLLFHHEGVATLLYILLGLEALGTALSFYAASRVV
jgi:hypothetical protein